MGKLIFWFVIGLVIMTVARIAARAGARAAQQQAREQARQQQQPGHGNRANAGGDRPGRPAAVQQAEQMVRCAHCGIHLPRSEAVLSAGETYCGQEHARLGVARH
ncbi:hypothetical protein CAL29_01665 [Bordetella genomosp. 10]|uniref:Deaminase n=1 Tax=Bordetella genomosp. 10 TaxID=1416804 RepID=A0A261SIE4_9BORD|nr:PP0621 family protein [Bordetella genomosp. 10]OZI37164.1 hypothetical protein CAL29_01665 [Bordetella genomosp. 10]